MRYQEGLDVISLPEFPLKPPNFDEISRKTLEKMKEEKREEWESIRSSVFDELRRNLHGRLGENLGEIAYQILRKALEQGELKEEDIYNALSQFGYTKREGDNILAKIIKGGLPIREGKYRLRDFEGLVKKIPFFPLIPFEDAKSLQEELRFEALIKAKECYEKELEEYRKNWEEYERAYKLRV
jgi:hypothetical protein